MRDTVLQEKKRKRRSRRSRAINSLGSSERVRLTVFRSAKHIYAQLVEAESGKTIATVSTRTKGLVDGATGNCDAAAKVGAKLAEIAREKNIDQVVFNRNGFLFHGRVKALAEAAREAGLQF